MLVGARLAALMPGARTAGTTDAITRPRGVEINREPLPVRREEIIGLVIRPKTESESSHKKITFLHKVSSQRLRTEHRD